MDGLGQRSIPQSAPPGACLAQPEQTCNQLPQAEPKAGSICSSGAKPQGQGKCRSCHQHSLPRSRALSCHPHSLSLQSSSPCTPESPGGAFEGQRALWEAWEGTGVVHTTRGMPARRQPQECPTGMAGSWRKPPDPHRDALPLAQPQGHHRHLSWRGAAEDGTR